MSDKDRLRLGERITSLVVRQIGDKSATLEAPGFELPSVLLPESVTEGHSIRLTITIESPHTRNDWSRAYAKQGASDLSVYKFLSAPGANISDCHRLHYLQMAGEKVAKAYQFRHTQKRLEDLLSNHVALPEFINLYCQSGAMKAKYAGREEQLGVDRRDLRHLAQEIEKLAPAVDRLRSPMNAEYPWTNGVALVVPTEHAYPLVQSFSPRVWQLFTQTLDDAAAQLTR